MKSNIGHLKGAAGAAGLLKAVLALHDKVLPPSLNFDAPEPEHRLRRTALLRQHRAARAGRAPAACAARGCVSAFGFGGTNFHVVLEEYVPGRLHRRPARAGVAVAARPSAAPPRPPLRGALVIGAVDDGGARARLDAVRPRPRPAGRRPPLPLPRPTSRAARVWRIDYALPRTSPTRPARPPGPSPPTRAAMWRALRAQGIFRGAGAPAQGGLPLHRPGLAVRQHAATSCAAASRSSPRPSPRPTAS